MKNNYFELPIKGASGYAAVSLNLTKEAFEDSLILETLNPGEGFTIIDEENEFLKISFKGKEGFIKKDYCLINLCDIMPSIVYNITNATSSIMTTSFKNIPNITGHKLYNAKFFNERFEVETYVVPVLYNMAIKIARIQKEALSNNETLIIYEAFRPFEVQKKISYNLQALADKDFEVLAGITNDIWDISWFISMRTSKHQMGLAIDVSLGKVIRATNHSLTKYNYKIINEYEEYTMPTPIHELSQKSVIFSSPVKSDSKELWKKASFSENTNEFSLKLFTYCTNGGLTPLASEWWHFNDLDCLMTENGEGKFYITDIFSKKP